MSFTKFLVVFNVRLLTEDNTTTLISDYSVEFITLCGKLFDIGLRNVYFVLTHNDKEEMTESEIGENIDYIIKSSLDMEDRKITDFFVRMRKFRITVNYEEDNGEELQRKLDNLLKMEEVNPILCDGLNLTHFDVYIEKLSLICEK